MFVHPAHTHTHALSDFCSLLLFCFCHCVAVVVSLSPMSWPNQLFEAWGKLKRQSCRFQIRSKKKTRKECVLRIFVIGSAVMPRQLLMNLWNQLAADSKTCNLDITRFSSSGSKCMCLWGKGIPENTPEFSFPLPLIFWAISFYTHCWRSSSVSTLYLEKHHQLGFVVSASFCFLCYCHHRWGKRWNELNSIVDPKDFPLNNPIASSCCLQLV